MKFLALHGDRTIGRGSFIDVRGELIEMLFNPFCPSDVVVVVRFDDNGKYTGEREQLYLPPTEQTYPSIYASSPVNAIVPEGAVN